VQLDIRLPIGGLFTVLGVLLTAQGLLAPASANARALGHNVNLGWGLVLLAAGVVFLVLARRRPGGAGG
jgi:hypothetical protein